MVKHSVNSAGRPVNWNHASTYIGGFSVGEKSSNRCCPDIRAMERIGRPGPVKAPRYGRLGLFKPFVVPQAICSLGGGRCCATGFKWKPNRESRAAGRSIAFGGDVAGRPP